MPALAVDLSVVFSALADPTRRALIQRLGRGPASMSALAEPFSCSLPTISQHLESLRHAGLVRSKKIGRVRTFQLTPKPLSIAQQWLTTQQARWEVRLDQLDSYLNTLKTDAS